MLEILGILIAIAIASRLIWHAVGAARDWARTKNSAPSVGISEHDFFIDSDVSPISELRIAYIDANGEASERDIAVFRVDLRSGFIEAYCHLRNDRRSFYIDRIQSACDLSTGEIVEDVGSHLRSSRAFSTRAPRRN
ncbi:WYL domain-containing protein [Paraburkholderia tropica]|uniref:WYL domain-containing protein n=1 Tax=Paraburkholderia tropica TaxID=92647 RepID=UPI0038B92AED